MKYAPHFAAILILISHACLARAEEETPATTPAAQENSEPAKGTAAPSATPSAISPAANAAAPTAAAKPAAQTTAAAQESPNAQEKAKTGDDAKTELAAQPGKPRPMSEMHGDCAHYALPLENEFSLWRASAFEVKAGTNSEYAGILEVGRRMHTKLERENKVKLAVVPEKPSRNPNRTYAGVFRFEVPKDGVYRVAAGSRFWVEVVAARNKSRLSEASFEMQSKCREIPKVIVYELKAGEKYWLQISAAEAQTADVLVSPAAQI